MPKIIENLPRRLLQEARRQLTDVGYAALNIRSVAKSCGVGIGTVYNYYPSKDALIAGFLLEDWRCCLERLREISGEAEEIAPVLRGVYDELTGFYRNYLTLFRDARVGLSSPPRQYHVILREQISGILAPFCKDAFLADFLSEAIVTWSVEEIPYEVLAPILLRAWGAGAAPDTV